MSRDATRIASSALAFSAVTQPGLALACPDCPAAQLVRASVFDQRFWSQLALVLLPLLILGAVAALTYRIGSPRGPSASAAQRGTKS